MPDSTLRDHRHRHHSRTQELRLFADLEPVTVLQHLHSASTPPGDGNEPGPQLPMFDPTPYIENPNLDPEELARFIESLADPQGGTWMYHFAIDDFRLLWGDSSGPIFQEEAAPVVEGDAVVSATTRSAVDALLPG